MPVVKIKKNGEWVQCVDMITNADTLDGKHAEEFATYSDLENLRSQIVADVELPTVTADNNGAFLRVVDGKWAVVTIENAEEATF